MDQALMEEIQRQERYYEEEQGQWQLPDQIKTLLMQLKRKFPADEEEAQERFSKAIGFLRERKGLTIADVAADADTKRAYLWQIESGRSKTGLETAKRIAKALGTTVYDLLTVEWWNKAQ